MATTVHDYNFLADMLKKELQSYIMSRDIQVLEHTIYEIASEFSKRYNNFNYDKFIERCGL